MVSVANWTGLPIGATMFVGRPVILSKPRNISVVPGASASGGGGAGGASGTVVSAGAAGDGTAAPGVRAGAATVPAAVGAGTGAGCAEAATMPDAKSNTITNGAFMATASDFAGDSPAAVASAA